MKHLIRFFKNIAFLLLLAWAQTLNAAPKTGIVSYIQSRGGSFQYNPDERGNCVPDYSYCGYKVSEEAIPTVDIKAVVPCVSGDATARIQAALNYVSSLEPDAEGFRGAVLLEPGQYEVSNTLWINASGVVLRGSGMQAGGTEILATMTDKTTLIRVKGLSNATYGTPVTVADEILPSGTFRVRASGGFRKGDNVLIRRGGMSQGRRMVASSSMSWERKVVSVEGDVLTLDAPLTCEMASENGAATVASFLWPGRIENCGVENLRLTSVYDKSNPKDENHCWIALAMENVRDAWVRRIEFRHFAGSAVFVAETASRITVEDCKSLEPVSEIGGQRRNSFYLKGSQCLFQRIQAEYGYHDFAVGSDAAGPNAFVQCWSLLPYSYSGTVESWSSGLLFDICCVDGEALRLAVPNPADAFSGWSATNSMFWNSTASYMSCPKPMYGQNWAYGAWGQFNGRGYWNGANDHVSPWSLFYAQLAARTGKPSQAKLITLSGGGTSSMADARMQTERSRRPLIMLAEFSNSLDRENPIDLNYADQEMKSVWNKPMYYPAPKNLSTETKIEIKDAWLLREGKILRGSRQNPSWWRGSLQTPAAFDPHIVRYALAPEGYGVVDDLEAMTDAMKSRGVSVVDFNYALWYDRRRDDHERTPRIDGDVRPPLYELPFARSGEGQAWDGLSRYDLTRWNNWYWNRLSEYADLADEKGLLLFYQHYFQHNIIEAGAHWADCPWRSANNVNETGFPEPVTYAGNKRIFMSELFYDETHPVRRALHRNYIRKCLDAFSEKGSVIHFTSAEYTGPLHFTEFWIDVIAEWEAETGKKAMVAISAPKNVQDALLKDSKRSSTIDIIDIRYWYVDGSGKEFAPEGGLNLAPRQFERIEKPQKASAESVYRMVKSYRDAYPEKAVFYSADSYIEQSWPAFMAGASCCVLPLALPEDFLKDAAGMRPQEASCWLLANPSKAYIVYPSKGKIQLDLSSDANTYTATWIDPVSGSPIGSSFSVKGGSLYRADAKGILWLRK